MIGRSVVIVAALLLALVVLRNAAVARFGAAQPQTAAAVWANHPSVELSQGMTLIAQAARKGTPVPPPAFAMIQKAAISEPLAPDPYLVRGVQDQLAGNNLGAQRAFEAAQWRDPRSLAAAYFLADRYFRVGDTRRGLTEVAALARLAPKGAAVIGPYLAAYARNPANWPALRSMFRDNPEVAKPALLVLASDAATAPAVIALAGPPRKGDQSPWLAPLLNTLAAAGEYQQARSLWMKATGAAPGSLLNDAGFVDKSSPPPFNWALTTSSVGLAERQAGGRLHLLFYGQEDGILATQLLLLKPGNYRLSMQLLGDADRARALTWSIWCDKAAAAISSVTLDAAARGWTFQVPPGCAAQWLKLSGSSGDMSQQADVTLARLKLEQVGASA